MSKKIGLSFLTSVLALGFFGEAQARPLREMNIAERRAYFKPDSKRVKSCPMDDDKFWSHWATERGYEQLFHGNLDEAANCYVKAGQMFRRGVAPESRNDCFTCDGYIRVGEILKKLPEGTINIRKETFEESAKRALASGDKNLAPKLYELTALGYLLGIEGEYGRFTQDNLIHQERTSWQNGYLKANEFLETAAELISSPKDKRRILRMARTVNHSLLTTGYCSSWDPERRRPYVVNYPECQQAKVNFDRLDAVLKSQ